MADKAAFEKFKVKQDEDGQWLLLRTKRDGSVDTMICEDEEHAKRAKAQLDVELGGKARLKPPKEV